MGDHCGLKQMFCIPLAIMRKTNLRGKKKKKAVSCHTPGTWLLIWG